MQLEGKRLTGDNDSDQRHELMILVDTRSVMVSGTVRVWHEDEGWGVIDSEVTPGGCWAHFSQVEMSGYRALRAGQTVALSFEPAEQDGYSFRAIQVKP